MKATGSLIAELRREAGYTQKTLADALDVTDKAISKWERGLCLPDATLLPKLSLLLDVDIELLMQRSDGVENKEWVGVIDCSGSEIDFSQMIYDKPLVDYLVIHFLLLGIKKIVFIDSGFITSQMNAIRLERYGIYCYDSLDSFDNNNLMIMTSPCFLFGSDLTRLFKGVMISDTLVSAKPMGMEPVFLFCPAEFAFMYKKNKKYLYDTSTVKNLGRGMVCIDLKKKNAVIDASNFVRIYQENCKCLIGDLSEIVANEI